MLPSHIPCAACKCLRRKCTKDCVFAPHFPQNDLEKFISVHKVYGTSNVGKLLSELRPDQRPDAVTSLVYEAQHRLRDPVHGIVGLVYVLQQRLRDLDNTLGCAKLELSGFTDCSAMVAIWNPPALNELQLQMGITPDDVKLINQDPQQQLQQQHKQHYLEIQQMTTAEREQQQVQIQLQQQQHHHQKILEIEQMANAEQEQQQKQLQQQHHHHHQEHQHQQMAYEQQESLQMRFHDVFEDGESSVTATGFTQMPAGAATPMRPSSPLVCSYETEHCCHVHQQQFAQRQSLTLSTAATGE